jgi:hypothetical protein
MSLKGLISYVIRTDRVTNQQVPQHRVDIIFCRVKRRARTMNSYIKIVRKIFYVISFTLRNTN